MYWSVVWCSGGCSWKCYKTLTFCSLLTRSTIPCACHAKRHLNLQKWSVHGVFCTFWLGNVLRATTACTFSTSQLPKVVRTWCALYILTWKCASCHNSVYFFDISTAKSGPYMVCFVHFDLEMCFAPQRRALFRHLNLQKWSVHGVFCKFWLGNVLRATTACTFSTSQLTKVVRTWCALYILTWKCASRHNSVHFFDISTSKSGPYMVCFVHFDLEMCFAPQRRALFRHLNFQKCSETQVFCTFSLGLPCSALHLSILSEVWLLNFLRSYLIIITLVLSPYHPHIIYIYIYTISIIKTYILTQLDVWWLMILHCSTCFSLMTQVTSPNAPRATRLCRCPALCPSSARRGASPAAPGADPVNTASSSFIKRWFLGNTYGFTIYLYIYIYIYIYIKPRFIIYGYNLWFMIKHKFTKYSKKKGSTP